MRRPCYFAFPLSAAVGSRVQLEVGRLSTNLLASLFLVSLASCGGGGDNTPPSPSPPAPTPPAVTLTYGVKQLRFSWAAVPGATHYRLFERPNAGAAFTQIGPDLATTSVTHDIAVHRRANAMYRIDSCANAGCTVLDTVSPAATLIQAIGYDQPGSGRSPFADFGELCGNAVAVSADGNTRVAACSWLNDTTLAGIARYRIGAVVVYTRAAGEWVVQDSFRASNIQSGLPPPATDGQYFGTAVALSADGNTIAVSAPGERSNATGINGNQADSSAERAGAVYVFARTAGVWSMQAYVKASNTEAFDGFGSSVALSADGSTLAVGAYSKTAMPLASDGNQADNLAQGSGAVYVFTRAAGVWSQQAYVKASNTDSADFFGSAVALSGDGNTMAVGAYGEASNATGVGGNQTNNSAANAGAVYLFIRTAGVWSQQAYVKASNAEANDQFGQVVALSADGNTMAAAAQNEASGARGIDGNQADNAATNAGAVYLFSRAGGTWSQQAYVKASNSETNDGFGVAVALSHDGNTLAVGAPGEDSNARGVGSDQTDNSEPASGAIYVFMRVAGLWSQQTYVKASNTERSDSFGAAVALSVNGDTLAVGAPGRAMGGGADYLY